jgi:Protein of unknown function (DUF2384)
MRTDMNEILVNTIKRWGKDWPSALFSHEDAVYIVSISLGLGALYDESAGVEREWMNMPHPSLGGSTPANCVFEGKAKAVLDVVNKERNI